MNLFNCSSHHICDFFFLFLFSYFVAKEGTFFLNQTLSTWFILLFNTLPHTRTGIVISFSSYPRNIEYPLTETIYSISSMLRRCFVYFLPSLKDTGFRDTRSVGIYRMQFFFSNGNSFNFVHKRRIPMRLREILCASESADGDILRR